VIGLNPARFGRIFSALAVLGRLNAGVLRTGGSLFLTQMKKTFALNSLELA
jgi:hypothetical protein